MLSDYLEKTVFFGEEKIRLFIFLLLHFNIICYERNLRAS